MKAKRFQIYGRTAYDKPLTFIQALEAQHSIAAEALALLGQDDWVELVAIPAEKLIQVIGEKEDG